MKVSRYAYIVPSNAKYLPGLNALLNSLEAVGSAQDVVVLSYRLPESYKGAVASAGFGFRVLFEEIAEDEVSWLGESEVLTRKRYAMPRALPQYEAFCILDADMFFEQDVTRYLEIAGKTGLVLGCVLEQKRRYGDENHQYPVGSGRYLIDPVRENLRDLACAPLFVGREWAEALGRSYDLVNAHPKENGRFRAPDMDALNICLIAAGSYDRTVPLSQHTWTGLHESMLKAHTRAVLRDGRLFTEDGEEINVVHGQFWSRNWRRWQTENQSRMIAGEFEGSPSYLQRSRESLELLCSRYELHARRGKIDIDRFLPELPTAGPLATVTDWE